MTITQRTISSLIRGSRFSCNKASGSVHLYITPHFYPRSLIPRKDIPKKYTNMYITLVMWTAFSLPWFKSTLAGWFFFFFWRIKMWIESVIWHFWMEVLRARTEVHVLSFAILATCNNSHASCFNYLFHRTRKIKENLQPSNDGQAVWARNLHFILFSPQDIRMTWNCSIT